MPLTVKELIMRLQKIDDKRQPVKIAIRQHNKAYPIAYTEPFSSEHLDQVNGEVRITTSLPSNMHTVKKAV
jgi:hypothetical protein